MRVLVFLLACWIGRLGLGQEVGSREAAKIQADIANRAAASETEWKNAKKLSVVDQIPERPHPQEACLPPYQLADDQVGYMDYWEYEILQVVGATDMILRMANPEIPFLWLADFPTKGCADGDKVRLVGLVEVKGTKTYPSLAGSQKTVRIIRFLSADETKTAEKKLAAEADAKNFRNWSDQSNKYHFEAKFLELKSGVVRLEGKDGRVTEVRLSRLSNDDQKWVREELKQRREKLPK